MRTSELIDVQLDWAVAKCESLVLGTDPFGLSPIIAAPVFLKKYHPSTDWSQGGPILEREKIEIHYYCNPDEALAQLHEGEYDDDGEFIDDSHHPMTGPTPLIAAMRCLVASKLGDEIEIPEELK